MLQINMKSSFVCQWRTVTVSLLSIVTLLIANAAHPTLFAGQSPAWATKK
jgi:hypothetical protein